MILTKVFIGREQIFDRGVVQDDALLGPEDVVEDRLRQRYGGHTRLSQTDLDPGAGGCRFRLDLQGVAAQKEQEPSFSTRVLNRGAHERVDQLLQDDLAR